MKYLLPILAIGAALTGCSHPDDDNTVVKPQVMQNPSGKPQTDAQTKEAAARQAGGEKANADMAAAAAAVKAAESKSGGK